jgi:hypothetical protein
MKKTVKKKKVVKELLVNFILDETGSMASCLNATIEGFNEYIKGLKARKEKIFFTLTQWDSSRFNVIYNAVKIKDVQKMTIETYRPGAMTNLYDAIGKSIKAVEQKLDGKKDKPNVLCVIMTDGEENASREYTIDSVRKLIGEKEKEGWSFVYLGANQDAWKVGQSMGVARMSSMTYDTNKTKGAFVALAVNTAMYCSAAGAQTRQFFKDTSAYDNAGKD